MPMLKHSAGPEVQIWSESSSASILFVRIFSEVSDETCASTHVPECSFHYNPISVLICIGRKTDYINSRKTGGLNSNYRLCG